MSASIHQKTLRLTVAQAVVKYLQVQYSELDGLRQRLIPAAFGIYGHGQVAGLGQALFESVSYTHLTLPTKRIV